MAPAVPGCLMISMLRTSRDTLPDDFDARTVMPTEEIGRERERGLYTLGTARARCSPAGDATVEGFSSSCGTRRVFVEWLRAPAVPSCLMISMRNARDRTQHDKLPNDFDA
jgi:hypothetical protein